MARNLLTDVAGLKVGNADDGVLASGVTVVLFDEPAVAAVDVRGGAPGTRETDLLAPSTLVERVDALVLSGGSAFGLAAAQGAVDWLAARGRGLPVGDHRVPIVPAAILMDLTNGGNKDWGGLNPYPALAQRACNRAGAGFTLGTAGAGWGAKAHRLKGGLGSASAVEPETGVTVGALIAANPLGSVVMPGTDTLWAWWLERDGELDGQTPPPRPPADPMADLDFRTDMTPRDSTTIGLVATDAVLSKAEAQRLAVMAQDGLTRAIRPSHSPFDGDCLFAAATGRRALTPAGAPEARARALARLGALAADTVARAVARGVVEAAGYGRFPAYREVRAVLAQGGP